jgi:adenylosuccinate lyase
MLGVRHGGDRQELHEVVRRHSLAVAEAVAGGATNDLIDRLTADPAFARVPAAELAAELEPGRYTGRAARQVGEFLAEFVRPLLERARPLAAITDAGEVRV